MNNKKQVTGNQKDFKPVIIYSSIYIGIQILISFTIGLLYGKEAMHVLMNISGIVTFALFLIITIIFIVIYHEQIKINFLKLNKKSIIYIIIGSIVLIIVNILLSNLLGYLNIKMENQEMITLAYNQNRVIMALSASLFAPFVEELAFRYGLSLIIKDNLKFIIVSSLIFGFLHGTGIAAILYISMGIILSIIYLKTDKNIVASIIAHMLNNIIAIVSLLIIIR